MSEANVFIPGLYDMYQELVNTHVKDASLLQKNLPSDKDNHNKNKRKLDKGEDTPAKKGKIEKNRFCKFLSCQRSNCRYAHKPGQQQAQQDVTIQGKTSKYTSPTSERDSTFFRSPTSRWTLFK